MSNSKNPTERYLEHAKDAIQDFLGGIEKALFIPYARVLPTFDDFTSMVREGFQSMGYEVDSIHTLSDQVEAVRTAEALIVGGGNTFHLLHSLQQTHLLETIRARANAGVPYIGWSAGSNLACPTIKTTNDMPIVEPRSFSALDLVPFQINPHYTDAEAEGYLSETREERLTEFIEVNPEMYVVGLRDGSMLRIEDDTIDLIGSNGVRIFMKGDAPIDYGTGDSLQPLLEMGHTQTEDVHTSTKLL